MKVCIIQKARMDLQKNNVEDIFMVVDKDGKEIGNVINTANISKSIGNVEIELEIKEQAQHKIWQKNENQK